MLRALCAPRVANNRLSALVCSCAHERPLSCEITSTRSWSSVRFVTSRNGGTLKSRRVNWFGDEGRVRCGARWAPNRKAFGEPRRSKHDVRRAVALALVGIGLHALAGCVIDDRRPGVRMSALGEVAGPSVSQGEEPMGAAGGMGTEARAPIASGNDNDEAETPAGGSEATATSSGVSGGRSDSAVPADAGSGSSGQATPPAPSVIPAGAVLAINDGVIAAGSNEFGIHGVFTIDKGPLNPAPALTYSAGAACVSGALDVMPLDGTIPDYANAWGFELVLPFAQSDTGERALWDRGGGRVAGLSFRITGPVVPEAFRFVVRMSDALETYCSALVATAVADPIAVAFDDLRLSCWDSTSERAPIGDLTLAAWQVEASQFVAVPYEFCVSEVRPLLAADVTN